MQRVLDQQVQDQVLVQLVGRRLILREDARVEFYVHFSDLGFEVCHEGICAVARLVEQAAQDPERRRQAFAAAEELLGGLVEQVGLLEEENIAVLAENFIVDDNLHVVCRLVDENVAGVD